MSVLPRDSNGNIVPLLKPGASQNVSVGSSSAQSSALGSDTTLIRAISTVDCYLAFGSNPTATTSGYFLAAYAEYFIPVDPGSKVAVIRSVSNGTLNIVEGA